MTKTLSKEELAVVKRDAKEWVDSQDWISDVWAKTIKEEIDSVITIVTPITNSTVYRHARLGIIDLSEKMVKDNGGVHSTVEALEKHGAYILRSEIEMIVVMAVADDHTLPKPLQKHPWDHAPKDHIARSWYTDVLAELGHYLRKSHGQRSTIWINNLVSKRVTYGNPKLKDDEDEKTRSLEAEMAKYKETIATPEKKGKATPNKKGIITSNTKGKAKQTKQPATPTRRTKNPSNPKQVTRKNNINKRPLLLSSDDGDDGDDESDEDIEITGPSKLTYDQLKKQFKQANVRIKEQTQEIQDLRNAFKNCEKKYKKYKRVVGKVSPILQKIESQFNTLVDDANKEDCEEDGKEDREEDGKEGSEEDGEEDDEEP